MPQLLHWFRRDLRTRDNTALLAAARRASPGGTVTGAFIIDPRWWHASNGKLGPFQARFWLASLAELRKSLRPLNIPLVIRTNPDPVAELLTLAKSLRADTLTYNKDYEPAQVAMDLRLEREAHKIGLRIEPHKDAAFFEEDELLTAAGSPYTVFTPYKNAYLQKLTLTPPEPAGLPAKLATAQRIAPGNLPTLADLGFQDVTLDITPGEAAAQHQLILFTKSTLPTYAATRDLPALSLRPTPGTSRLSAHLSAGTLSIRQALAATFSPARPKTRNAGKQKSTDTFRAELVWRDFYRMILFHHPHTVSRAFRPRYDGLPWDNDPALFDAWASARTGYPLVDAAMRQLLATGFMHNRLRMVAAMFLTKDLDTHWTRGERFFMRTLVDYDQASNVGGWQWSASTGTDAAPYFRIMNPALQSKRWDPQGVFLKHYLPELQHVPPKYIHTPDEMPLEIQQQSHCLIGQDYPAPIVNHTRAKQHAIPKFRHI